MCESDGDRELKTNCLLNRSTTEVQKKTNNYPAKKCCSSGLKQILHNSVDPNYLYCFSKRIVRIEYPGVINNAVRAIETLGGMHRIQMAVADHRNKLELHFHPENKFNKPCCADRDLSPGVLIKIKQTPQADPMEMCSVKYDYEIVGITSLNFKFNRMCDFQYLPLVSTNTAGNDLDMEYTYDKILPQSLPRLEWFLSKESSTQPIFYIPTNFARFDNAQFKLYVNAGEKFGSNVRPEISKIMENKPKKIKHISTKQISIFINFQIPNVQVPDQPLPYTMDLIRERNLEKMYKAVKKLFEERPVWTKVAIQYKTGLNTDHAKIILPAVAYFCPIGPWRMTWVRYEYNPQKDFNSRIYQTLDYRIRATEGTKLKVNPKRSYTSKMFNVTPNSIKKVSLKNMTPFKREVIEESSYVLRPNYIPPARQMFYQYCDILIPEIQEMISRLPKLPAGTKFDPKNGWLPVNFTEQCREIANRYVMDRVQEELLEDTIKLQQQQNIHPENVEKECAKETPSTYCSKMLSNIKKGIYKSVTVIPTNEVKNDTSATKSVHTVDLIEDLDEDELEQINADDVVNSIPERMEENSDDEHLSQNSDLDIDMEAVEEVNKMIAGIQEDEEVNVVASYLKNKI